MERAEDGAKLVPLRHRGFHRFAALHKNVMLGTESPSVGAPEKIRMCESAVLTKGAGGDIAESTESAPNQALSTYKADFVRYDLPTRRVESLAPQCGNRVPFRATTTYRMDYRIAVCSDDPVLPAGAGPRPSAVEGAALPRRGPFGAPL
ncbi:hypothetical protein BBBOND_0202180 [Babesia bigemina]|uniref:Uncharacterized protein n=1 Tax=Babesia bigemina TaxID=5866 RepID=A0A061D2Q8_BABBI|nr:hypothetical protein BBBOND_0202180 [Babesia bigemina]CDR95061.1 hypothetical protein BBBOND_0202180 [Babesia bigemina]|eukprot:XP_012767247.1 hypothetical protein BBBOND_0202180 [Babesia bigemina]